VVGVTNLIKCRNISENVEIIATEAVDRIIRGTEESKKETMEPGIQEPGEDEKRKQAIEELRFLTKMLFENKERTKTVGEEMQKSNLRLVESSYYFLST
jgi:hypothetical protein